MERRVRSMVTDNSTQAETAASSIAGASTMTTKYSQVLSVLCPVLLMASILQAQPKGVRIDVEVLHVDRGLAGRLAQTTAGPAELLGMLMADRNTGMISRSRLRVSDGRRGELRVPSTASQPGGDAGFAVWIQPQIHLADEVTLHVEFNSFDGPRKVSSADIRLHEGEANILRGMGTASKPGQELVIVLTPYILQAP
jgi:hypothetical protein